MIRLDLLKRQKPRRGRWLAGAIGFLLLAALGVAGLYELDSHYPLLRSWNQWRAGDEAGPPSARIDLPQTRPLEPLPDPADSQPVVKSDASQALEPADTLLQTSAPSDTSAAVPPTDPALAGRHRPRWNDACRQILTLAERLPSTILFQSLLSNAQGEYTIEGMGTSPDDVRGVLLDTLQNLPSQSSLTRWREGLWANRAIFEFTIQGHLDTLESRPLAPLSPDQAHDLSAHVYQWAQQSGLTIMATQDSIQVPLAKDLIQQRLKIWTTGTHIQMTSFIAAFDQTDQARLEELVLVPVYKAEESCWHQGHLYTAIDMLVQR